MDWKKKADALLRDAEIEGGDTEGVVAELLEAGFGPLRVRRVQTVEEYEAREAARLARLGVTKDE